MDSNNKWIQVVSWHLLADTRLTPNGTWMAKTLCGIERVWDQTFLDALPGGEEKSCENCLIVKVGGDPKKPTVKVRKKK